MTLTEARRETLQKLVTLLERVPDGEWVEITEGIHGPQLRFQGCTQEHTKDIRAFFPGTIWKKAFDPLCHWWTYDGTFQGVDVHIYAVREAPPTCRAIEEEERTMESVPIAWEEREVVKTVVRWDCDSDTTSS